MAGQSGFQTTDPLPPHPGPMFAAEDVNELGLELCLTVWQRLKPAPSPSTTGATMTEGSE